MINFTSWWMSSLLDIKSISNRTRISVRSNEPYAGNYAGGVEIWELLFLIVKNWPILTFIKCYAILQVSWADMTVGRTVLWSICTKLRGPPAENWCCGLQSYVRIHEGLLLKNRKRALISSWNSFGTSWAIASHCPCHFFLRLLSG